MNRQRLSVTDLIETRKSGYRYYLPVDRDTRERMRRIVASQPERREISLLKQIVVMLVLVAAIAGLALLAWEIS
jgi:hypothetical protein